MSAPVKENELGRRENRRGNGTGQKESRSRKMAAKNKVAGGGTTPGEEIVVFSTFLRFSPLKLSICIGRKGQERKREKER